ncbi:hypothetical protein SAMN05421841_2777 [Chryseobacterium wanjuense]|uniref:Uncharacterized protein n=1 Tax=Chryseobacterium wanjuense TaxID=356305 RepID=A0A1I0RK03_9FLAO|nr:hypothetical protein SAMN05421841_2777 [Chryseobacterium wanjuense]
MKLYFMLREANLFAFATDVNNIFALENLNKEY